MTVNMSNHEVPSLERSTLLHRAGRTLAAAALLLPNAGCAAETIIPDVPFLPGSADRTSECAPAWVETKGLGPDGQTTRYTGSETRVSGVVVKLYDQSKPVESGPATQLYIEPSDKCTFPDFVQFAGTDVPLSQANNYTVGKTCAAFNIPDGWVTFANPDQTPYEELRTRYIFGIGNLLDPDFDDHPGKYEEQRIDLRPQDCP